MTDLTGHSIGRYQIVGPLGQGGMATVYKAYDTRLERHVAIKIIRKSAFSPEMIDQLLKRFEREAKSLARLTHPNIVDVHDFGEHDGSPYLVMEFIAGGNLKDRMGKAITWQEAARLLLPVAKALAYAHQSSIIHRDVKPSNIMLTKSGDPMLTDFGIAKMLDVQGLATLTGTGVGIGTPEYMSPEQGLGQPVDGRADVYGLGVVLYELVTGRRPFEADTPMAVILKHVTNPLPRPRQYVPDLPEEVEGVLYKALAKRPEDRYEDMGAFAGALEGLILGRERQVRDETSTMPAWTEQSTQVERTVQKTPISQVPVVKAAPAEPAPAAPAPRRKAAPILDKAAVPPPPPTRVEKAPPARPRLLPIWVWGAGGVVILLGAIGVLIVGYLILRNIGAKSKPTYLNDLSGTYLVLVSGGSFNMGSSSGEMNESPVHEVTLDPFYMDIKEVTNAQYQACVAEGACQLPSKNGSAARDRYYDEAGYADFPVIYVTWYDAQAYCNWRRARLPTEAEWEKASRGGAIGKSYPWGNNSPVCTSGATNGAQSADCGQDTDAVGMFAANKYGLFDMAGNVWEWVSDWYDSGYYQNSAPTNPTGPSTGDYRVLRGGSWSDDPESLRVSLRNLNDPNYSANNIGFRCARLP